MNFDLHWGLSIHDEWPENQVKFEEIGNGGGEGERKVTVEMKDVLRGERNDDILCRAGSGMWMPLPESSPSLSPSTSSSTAGVAGFCIDELCERDYFTVFFQIGRAHV